MRTVSGTLALALIIPGSIVAQQDKGDKEIAFQGTVTIPFQNAGDGTTGTLIPRFGYYLNSRNFVGIESDTLLAKGYQAEGLSLLYRFYMGKKGSRFQPYAGLAPGILGQRTPVSVEIVVTQASANAASAQITNATNLTAAQKAADQTYLNTAIQNYQQGCLLTPNTANGCTQVPSGTRKVSTGDFQGAGELGFKFYLNRKFAFDTSYRLTYVHQSESFAQDLYTVTNSTLTPTSQVVTFSGPTHNDGQKSGNLGFKQSANNFLLFGFSYVF